MILMDNGAHIQLLGSSMIVYSHPITTPCVTITLNNGMLLREDISYVTTMVAETTIPADLHGFLNPTDHVAISFWIVSIAMVASTCFFLMGSTSVGDHWKTSLNV